MNEYFKTTLNDSNKLFSFFVIFILSVVTIPITLKEAFTKEVKYYNIGIEGFPINEIASYQVSILYIFVIFLLIIHANKLLLIVGDILNLLTPFLEKKLGISKPDDFKGN